MKKILEFVYLLSIFIFLSCTNDDSISENEIDPLLGNWVLNRIEAKGMLLDITDCDKENFYSFSKDKVMHSQSLLNDYECSNTNCEGEWKRTELGTILTRYDFELNKGIGLIVMNEEETEIEEFVDVTLPDGSIEERLYIFTKE